MAMNIVAHEDTTGYAPADSRWCAYDANTYDGPGCPLGKGATEAEAITDLEAQLDAADLANAVFYPCECCRGTGWITVRTTWPMTYVCAGSPPDDARGVCEAPCHECGGGS